jgi:hypothetical protein
VEDKEFINERKLELEKAKNNDQWKNLADLFKIGNTQNIITKNPNKKVAPNKLIFKYKSVTDVLGEKDDTPVEEMSRWEKFWQENDSKQYEKRLIMCPQKDYGIPDEDQSSEDSVKNEDDKQDEPEFVSRNKVLQDKYDEDFHSHIISTGTVSIVAEIKDKHIFNREQLYPSVES